MPIEISRIGSPGALPLGAGRLLDAVIARLGQVPQQLPAVQYDALPMVEIPDLPVHAPQDKVLVGVDVFVQHDRDVAALAEAMNAVVHGAYGLSMITNRGVKVWPEGAPETFCTDHWRCRFVAATASGAVAQRDIVNLLAALTDAGVDVIKTENLCTFDGVKGFALGQGQ